MTTLLFVAGLAALILGAEFLVRGASRLATLFGISPLIIGLTVVAFGTSSPELAVSLKAALSDRGSVAIGNIVGSNIFNVLFILGLTALITPLRVAQQLVRLDVPLMIGLSLLVLLLARDGSFTRGEGVLLLCGLALYLGFLLRQSRREDPAIEAEYADAFAVHDRARRRWGMNALLVTGGLALLVLGSRWLVDSSVVFAKVLGVSELIIGLTIVAAGTSLPEVVTSVVAAVRGERDIAVGNVVGSNIFNLMGVLGAASLAAPAGIHVAPAVIGFDIPVMIAVALACLPIFFTGAVISRAEGGLLLAYYLAYLLYLVLAAAQHDALPVFSVTLLYFVMPLTAVTLLGIAIRQIRRRRLKG